MMDFETSTNFADWKAAEAEARAAHGAMCARVVAGGPSPTPAEFEETSRLVMRAHELLWVYLAGVRERAERHRALLVRGQVAGMPTLVRPAPTSSAFA